MSKENSSTAEVLESVSRSVRVKPENLRLAEVRHLQHFHVSAGHFKDWTKHLTLILLGGKKTLPAHVSAVPFPRHTVLLWHVVLLWGAFQRTSQRESGIAYSATGNRQIGPACAFLVLSTCWCKHRLNGLLFALQKLQVPNTPISKCAACLKPPGPEEEKLKRCTRCYRVGYCNQWVSVCCFLVLSCITLAQCFFMCKPQHAMPSCLSNECCPVRRVCQRNHWPNHKGMCRPNAENVGLPFLISVPESRLSYPRLTQLLEGYSRYTVFLVESLKLSQSINGHLKMFHVGFIPLNSSDVLFLQVFRQRVPASVPVRKDIPWNIAVQDRAPFNASSLS